MYEKACELYDQILADGLTPDATMYGCLLKFSVECGRTDLTNELFKKVPNAEIQNYMSLIRAAGRDKDANRALDLLAQLKTSEMVLDIAVYNCVLDACVICGEMTRAKRLVEEMATLFTLDIITYNTLLKGYCSRGRVEEAKAVLVEMESRGLAPNDISLNCLVNAAVSAGKTSEAWEAIGMMQQRGIPVDRFTLAIIMKAVKNGGRSARDVSRVLALLDTSGVDVCADEVLLVTVLDMCVRHGEGGRVARIQQAYEESTMQPGAHTYGALIKGCGFLKRVERCYDLWTEMTETRAMEPSEFSLGCMLDALVSNGCVDDAVDLFRRWQGRVNTNTVMYSTLIKGFACSKVPEKAMSLWSEMVDMGLKLNTVVYNGLIDAQARVGRMDEVVRLVDAMEADQLAPDSITHSTIIKGYCVKGDLEQALALFKCRQRAGHSSDTIIFNTP